MANNIKEIREQKGVSQIELASVLGISQASLSNKESGRRSFTVKEVLKIEEFLEVSIKDMFKEV